MERTKKLIEEIRENLRLVTTKIEALQDEDINLKLSVGTNNKTVDFPNISTLEFTLTAKVQQDL